MKTPSLFPIIILTAALLLNAPLGNAQDPAPATPAATPAVVPSSTGAQPSAQPAAPGGNRADRMEQFRQKMNEFLKTSLKVSDEEWAVIQPLLEKVQAKQRETLTGRFSFMMNRGGGGHPASPETEALKTALESENTTPADIKAKLEAVRDARKKGEAELTQAREDLRKVLTQRQEATLVMVGILE